MHKNIIMINEEEREKRQLNNSISGQINKGFDLMLTYLSKKKEKISVQNKKIFDINLSQKFIFFNRDISFNLAFNFDINKKE